MDAKAQRRLQQLRRLRDGLAGAFFLPLAKVATASSSGEVILSDAAASFGRALEGGSEGITPQHLAQLLARQREFRGLVYYRLAHDPSLAVHLLLPVLRAVWKPEPTLYFHPDSLGPGCHIMHGFSTGVAAKSIGRDFVVYQQVTIGSSDYECPTIGDGVSVMAGAIVLGGINVGDGAVIAAGAVVVSDVPPRTTVAGVPARPIRSS